MYIAEIIRPGTWLDLSDRELSFEIEGMLQHMEDLVAEAAIALTMFESSHSSPLDLREERERDSAIRQEVDDALRLESGENYYRDFDAIRIESDRRVLRRKIEMGILPSSYAHKIPFIHAHSFVYAIDSFGKFLEELCEYGDLPGNFQAFQDEFNDKLPMVRKVRNSALHIEDRSRRYASLSDKKKGKRMTVRFLGLSNLEGNQICYTIDDGSYQKVTISVQTLAVLVDILTKVLSALPWKGPAQLHPSC